MKVTLKSITSNAENNIVEIARVSSTRKDKSEKPEGLINYLIKNKHWSPFEHSFITFEIVTSKAIGIQLLRHRSFTFQEFSQRYAEVENFEPVELRKQADKNRQSSSDPIVWNMEEDSIKISDAMYGAGCHMHPDDAISGFMRYADELYKGLLRLGVAKECARMYLPMCTQTTIYMTGNIRSWIHFLQIRDDEHAQKEIQFIAKEIKKLFTQNLPIISTGLNFSII